MNEERLHIDWGNEKLFRTQKQVEKNCYDLEAWSILLREAQSKHISEVRSLYEHLITIFPSASREKMAQAYDFALDKIGMDIHSYGIWNDYVNFLKSVDAVGSYAENQKIGAVRKVYQRGIINPMIGMETFWKDYISFEQNINAIIAEKMSIERSRDYMNSRRVAKELEVQIRGINRNAPSVPPNGTPEERKQVELWQKYIEWEKSNPLRTEDTALHTKRVIFALEQCLLCLGHHPDIWYQAAQFLELSSKILTEKGDVNASKLFSEEAANVFERATSSLLSRNMLLYFAYADYEEGRLKYDKVHQIYCKYLDIQDIDPTLAYIQYMKFARRAEGIKSARSVFKRAREDNRALYHIFVCAAIMEYYCSKDKNIAFRIFELGLKKFGDIPEYVTCYIDYLSHLNEDNNTRVLFERVLSSGSLENEKSVDIWNKFLEFECNIGDLQSIVKVERRRAEVLSKIKEFEGKETAQLVDRYRFLDLFPCTPQELKSIGYTDVINITGAAGKSHFLQSIINQQSEMPLPRPDYSQMIPYKPKSNPLPGEHPIPGGSFPMPPSAAHLCTLLPPPHCFRGPFVHIDIMMDIFTRLHLPDQVPAPTEHGDVRLFDIAKSVHWIVEENGGLGVKRRKKLGLSMDGSDDEDMHLPPMNDIYRQRQQKKVRI
ncbi:hypothetical protein HUJ04_000919 [Dendroctonus ponderosae]|nr:hypothetical protein HUJ04_000919 [Dendroctonus ponderosae]